jgi:hypothetical protein
MLQNEFSLSPDAGRASLSPTPANGPSVTTLAPNSDETIAIRRPVTITWTVLDRPTTQDVIQVTARIAVGNNNTDRNNDVLTVAAAEKASMPNSRKRVAERRCPRESQRPWSDFSTLPGLLSLRKKGSGISLSRPAGLWFMGSIASPRKRLQ